MKLTNVYILRSIGVIILIYYVIYGRHLASVDDILLACNDVGLSYKTKQLMSKTFDIKDLSDASFVLGIKICRNLLRLSQRPYIDCVLSRLNI